MIDNAFSQAYYAFVMSKISILIADDHPLFREGLNRILQDEEGIECVAQAADGLQAVSLAQQFNPDVALVDINMPKINGIEVTNRIKSSCKNTAVLIISAFDYDYYILAALQAGARGYILKSTNLKQLVAAIRLVHNGDSVLDINATNKVLRHLSNDDGKKNLDTELLHARELEVLKLTAQGQSNKEIALNLGISERTVQTHLLNIFRKLGANSRTQAVLYALKEGWVNLDSIEIHPSSPS